jgi:hypothetical protein
MTIADTSGTRLAWVAEVTEGVTPATPAFQNLRFTGETLKGEKQTVTSNEIRVDGNIPDVVKVGFMANGGFDFELSYGTFDALLESALLGTWATNVLKNGRDRHAFTFEKTFDTGATDVFRRYLGCMINTTTLNFVAKQIVTGNMSMIGRDFAADAAIISGATYASANTKKVMNCSSDFGSLSLVGVSPALQLKSVRLNLNNNLRAQDKIGTDALAGVGLGQHVVTGSIEAYLENKSILDTLDDHLAGSLTMTIGSVTNEKYTISLPKLYLTSGDAATPGNNQDVMVNMDFQAVLDTSGSPANNCSIKITRAVA